MNLLVSLDLFIILFSLKLLITGVRSKVYSFQMENHQKQRLKGVDRGFTKKYINHQTYKEAIEGVMNVINKKSESWEVPEATFYRIESSKHQVRTVKKSKKTISFYNDKKYYINPSHCYSFGHRKIKEICE